MRILDMIGSMSRELLVLYGIILSVLFIIPAIIFEIKGWHSGFIPYLAFTLFILAATTLVFVFHFFDVKPFLKAVLLSVAVAIITILITWLIWQNIPEDSKKFSYSLAFFIQYGLGNLVNYLLTKYDT